jgi:hypothetical protein
LLSLILPSLCSRFRLVSSRRWILIEHVALNVVDAEEWVIPSLIIRQSFLACELWELNTSQHVALSVVDAEEFFIPALMWVSSRHSLGLLPQWKWLNWLGYKLDNSLMPNLILTHNRMIDAPMIRRSVKTPSSSLGEELSQKSESRLQLSSFFWTPSPRGISQWSLMSSPSEVKDESSSTPESLLPW